MAPRTENVVRLETPNTKDVVKLCKERLRKKTIVDDARGEYQDLCKAQNEKHHLHKKAMNYLTSIMNMGDDKYQDFMRTFEPGLAAVKEARDEVGTADMLTTGS